MIQIKMIQIRGNNKPQRRPKMIKIRMIKITMIKIMDNATQPQTLAAAFNSHSIDKAIWIFRKN